MGVDSLSCAGHSSFYMDINEQWLPVVGYESFYEVSNLGRVRTIPRMIKHKSGWSTRNMKVSYMKLHLTKFGHLRLTLVGEKGREFRKPVLVHRLVAEAFIPNPEGKPHINHIDNNPSNNRIENLEWCTPQENMTHAANCNRMKRQHGITNGNSTLSEEQVLEIRSKYIPRKYSQRMLAREYNVDQMTIQDIVKRNTWNHI